MTRSAYWALDVGTTNTVMAWWDGSTQRPRMLALWLKLADGLVDEIEQEPWRPGPRPPRSPEETARREEEIAACQRQQDREFYDGLGSESTDETCRSEGCRRGRIRLSVQVRGRACPFGY